MRARSQIQDLQALLEPSLMFQKVGVGREVHPKTGANSPFGGHRGRDTGQVSGLGHIGRKVVNVATHCIQLPAEALDRVCAGLQGEQLIDQAGNDVRAERKPSRPVAFLLPLEPGALEKWLVIENVRR